MINAFRKLGFQVDIIEGYGAERKKQIKALKTNIRNGTQYDFLYSETSTSPTLLNESHHFPTYPLLDFSFFSFCKKHGIKIGLFYRDIYWCFLDNKNYKEYIANFFYKYDLRKYIQLLDVFFLPSMEMLKYIPFVFKNKVAILPPGLDINILPNKASKEKINILYIGGIGNHYNLKMITKVISEIEKIHFTICCRKDEWEKVKYNYEPYLSKHIEVVHEKGENLIDLYSKIDIFSIFVEPSEYRSFAVPYKLFESIGYGRPILASKGTWVGEYVQKYNIGIVCEYDEIELKKQLMRLVQYPAILDNYKKNIETILLKNTWETRCKTVSNLLSNRN
jgi:glycosyltransferase involved in cell wall biosynthesis